MRIALISDIHGDLASLQRALTAIEQRKADQIWCLGDITDALLDLDPKQQLRCLELVRQHCQLVLLGNHDFWNLESGRLGSGADAMLRTLEPMQQCNQILAVHGSPEDPKSGFISATDQAWDALSWPGDFRAIVHGHTHRPALWHLGDQGETLKLEFELDLALPLNGLISWIINPGAVGDGYDPSWCMLDTARDTATWHAL